MARKHIKVSKRILFTWFLLGGIILLFAPERFTGKLQTGYARIFRVPLGLGRSISLASQSNSTAVNSDDSKEVEYQNYIANLEIQIEHLQRKIQQLSGLRERLPLEGVKLIGANVATAATKGPLNELIINRGAIDGIKKGQFVLGFNSIIGSISQVDTQISHVQLFTDSAAMTNIEIENSQTIRLLKGNGNNQAKIQMLQTKHIINVGDKIFARPKSGFLDSSMIIGKVSKCRKDTQRPLLWDVTVVPVCDIEKLTGVAVIIMNQ